VAPAAALASRAIIAYDRNMSWDQRIAIGLVTVVAFGFGLVAGRWSRAASRPGTHVSAVARADGSADPRPAPPSVAARPTAPPAAAAAPVEPQRTAALAAEAQPLAPVSASPAATPARNVPPAAAADDAAAVASLPGDERASVLRIEPRVAERTPPAQHAPPPAGAGDATSETPPSDARVASAPRAAALAAPAADLDGWWEITNEVDGAKRGDRDARVAYRVQLQQDGDRVTGRGFKSRRQDRAIAVGQRTPISISGKIDGASVDAEIVERSARRPRTGRLRWTVTRGGETLSGRFASSTGETGSSVAVKADRPDDEQTEPAPARRHRRGTR
jgi:hypothetical protein